MVKNETHRFHQTVGKQYSYNKRIAELSEINPLKLELRRKEVELDILKNTRNWKESVASNSRKISGRIER